ncbi:MAG: hypothetical protein H6700_05750 [Myxococcales bacterium]|nr:hypothetical protein [Myxococcales bacterium]MCB9520129.1 hypothetical protein [Myxococcales bacterium]MCB9531250.1 hypothetical protein [Myxococcales bacterium]
MNPDEKRERLIDELRAMARVTRRARLQPGAACERDAAPMGWWVRDDDDA